MAVAFNKEIFRSIKGSLARFLAIALIVALGTGFYAGLRMTAPDMKLAADEFYDGTKLYDIRILSTLGMTDEDVKALEQLNEIEAVMPAYATDMIALINEGQYTVRIHSLDIKAAQASDISDGTHALSEDDSYLNRPILVEGGWPTKSGECVLSADRVMDTPVQIGDTVEIIEGLQEVDEVLTSETYTVVGLVNSSYYSSPTSLGSTSLGSGYLQQYMFIPDTDFAEGFPYTEAFVSVVGATEEKTASDPYKQTVLSAEKAIKAIAEERERARYTEVKEEAQAEYDKADSEYKDAREKTETELENARIQLDEATATIDTSEQALADAQVEYDSGVAQMATSKTQSASIQSQAYQKLSDMQAQADAASVELAQAQTELHEGWAGYQDLLNQISVGYADLALLTPGTPEYLELEARLVIMQQTADALKLQLDESQAVYDANRQAFDALQVQLSAGWSTYYAGVADANAQLAAAQTRLDDAATQIAQGQTDLEAGKTEYEQNLALYEESKAEAEEKFAEAETELADAQDKINSIETPTWYVMDRTKNVGAESFQSDAGRIDQISQVFPFLFFLVAALVALTTMTRMVDEERMLIGTHKALGYSKAHVASKYIIYALLASGIGSAAGIALLSQVLPAVIIRAYAIVYSVPAGPTPIDVPIATLSAALGIGVTLIATAGAAVATLREKPALLMLPRAPKPGKRILLERITPLWKRVSFSWKVTFRNIFRYKRRFFMTIIGISGCTALLLTGLGLSDAINDIIAKQYYDIYRYNTIINLNSDITSEGQEEVDAIIDEGGLIKGSTNVYETSFKVSDAQGREYTTYVVVPEDTEDIPHFIDIRNRHTQAPLALSDDSIVICEKLANKLGIDEGDTISFSEVDEMGNAIGDTHDFIVGGICENYVGTFAYASPAYYEKVTGETIEFNTILANATADEDERKTLSDNFLAIEGVKTVGYNDESIESYQSMLKSVDSIVVVLVVAAAVLAFVVLYNLTNINITERQREIATLKVLGFVPREVDAYIFRETILLTIIGAFVGLGLGIFMESYVVVTAEVDAVMFGREIHALSFVIAFFVTLVFALLVALAMRKKLTAINMVESLKSVE